MSRFGTLAQEVKFTIESWRGNFWFLPAIMGLVSLIIFVLSVWLDRQIKLGVIPSTELPFWFAGGADASRDVLSTIGAAIGTITTVVFSITILTLQLASSQYTPRLLRTFTKSTWGQVTLGAFVSTVAFSILTLSVIRDEGPNQDIFVPEITINIAKLMALISLGLLVFFIGHIAVIISPSHIVRSTRQGAIDAYKSYIDGKIGDDAPPSADEPEGAVLSTVKAQESGYIQSIRASRLISMAEHILSRPGSDIARIMVKVSIGDYAKKGDTLAQLMTEQEPDGRLLNSMRKAFVIGEARLAEGDFRYGIDELLSIALRRVKDLDANVADECVTALVEIWLDMMEQPVYPPNRWVSVEHDQVHLALVPVDTDGQLADALRGIQDHAIGTNNLIDLASSVHEGLATVARESAAKDCVDTFECCWPELIWSTCQLVQATDEREILRRVTRALLPVKPVICDRHPDRWEELAEPVRAIALKTGKREMLSPIWIDS